MTGHDSEADVFSVPDFWQTSRWLEQPNWEALTPLFTTELDAASDQRRSDFILFTPITLDEDGFFKLPALGISGIRQPDAVEQDPEDADTTAGSFGCADVVGDVWSELTELPQMKVGWRTWDSFNTGELATQQPMLISEAGPAAYDALLCCPTDPLELHNSNVSVVDAKTYFSALLALTLGRDSVFFRKEEDVGSFKPALPEIRTSGYSRQVLQGIESQAHWCGSTFVQLNAFVRSAYTTNSSRCGVALASSVSHVLQAAQQRVVVDGLNPRSLLQLQSSIKEVSTILAPLQKLILRVRRQCSDKDILSLVFHTASSLDGGEGYVRDVFREILRRVSAPWIELLEEWIGTKREDGPPLTKSKEGDGRGFVKIEAEAYVDDFGRKMEEVDFRLDPNQVPDFMPDDVMKLIFATGRNLRFIRSVHPDHPLAQQAIVGLLRPPKAEWLYNWGSILELEGRVTRYRDSLYDALHKSRRNFLSCPPHIRNRAPEGSPSLGLDVFGLGQDVLEEQLLASLNQLNQPIAGQNSEDTLGKMVRERLSEKYRVGMNQADATPHWSLLPVLSFGGIISAQAQVVNQESLRLLFDAHDIRGHLRLQRNFHLLGNGMFCSRLSHTLFDPDLESTERTAGIGRQGGVMGLRLGGRDTWPPASSELGLALMGVLAESSGSGSGSRSDELHSRPGTGSCSLPGDLSFAIRDLSAENIDKCMDPDSLEALDFLRLSYKTPPELAAVITPINLMNYDRIFKLLLRILRMLHVVNQQSRDIKARAGLRDSWKDRPHRFAVEAQHFVSSVASYFQDTGIAIPWQMFEARLDQVQAELGSHEGDVVLERLQSPDQLRELHAHVLDRIMLALLLRKRQQPALRLLEDILGTVLRYAKSSRQVALGRVGEAEGEQETAELYADFKNKRGMFITVCRGMSQKGRAGSGRTLEEPGVGDESLVAQLLTKLGMDNEAGLG